MPDSFDSIFCASAKVFTGEVCQRNTMFTSESTRPIQFNSAVLKRTPCVPSFSSSADGRRADADRGAVLGSDIVHVRQREEAAGARHVLRHDVGLPGMCLPIWRATSRA